MDNKPRKRGGHYQGFLFFPHQFPRQLEFHTHFQGSGPKNLNVKIAFFKVMDVTLTEWNHTDWNKHKHWKTCLNIEVCITILSEKNMI